MTRLNEFQLNCIKNKEPKASISKDLQFIIQIPVYNEMPESDNPNYVGNIIESLRSILISYRELKRNKGKSGDLEVLLNINNPPGIYNCGRKGTLSNQRALNFLNYCNSNKVIKKLENSFSWIKKGTKIESEYLEFIDLYRKMIKQGFSLHIIDCTDGTTLSRNQDTQGTRRRLLAEIALRRFSKSIISERNKLMIFTDADINYSTNFFTDLEKNTWKNNGTVIFAPPYFIKDIQMPKDFLQEVEHTMLYYHYKNIMKSLVRIYTNKGYKKKTTTFSAILASFVTNLPAYKKVGGFNTKFNSREDRNYLDQLEESKIEFGLNTNPFVIIKDRLRKESYIGQLERRSKLLSEKITFSDDFISFLIKLRDNNILDATNSDLFSFPALLIKYLHNGKLNQNEMNLWLKSNLDSSKNLQDQLIGLFIIIKSIEMNSKAKNDFPNLYPLIFKLAEQASKIEGVHNVLNIFSRDRPDLFTW